MRTYVIFFLVLPMGSRTMLSIFYVIIHLIFINNSPEVDANINLYFLGEETEARSNNLPKVTGLAKCRDQI